MSNVRRIGFLFIGLSLSSLLATVHFRPVYVCEYDPTFEGYRFPDGSLINPAVKPYLPAMASISFYGALKALETRAWFRPFLTTQGSSSNGKYCLSLLSECALKYVLTAVIYKSVRKALKPTKVAPSVDRAEDESFCGYD